MHRRPYRYSSYTALFNWISTKAQLLNPDVERPIMWQETLTDYESGLLPAIQNHDFGTPIRVKGCHFHHCQAIYRRVQRAGLTEQYRRHLLVRSLVRGLFAIAYLPVNEVVDGFDDFIRSEPSVQAVIAYPQLNDVIQYYRRKWITGRYPLNMWNTHEMGKINNNNNIEAWNRQANDSIGNHYLLWHFMVKLKRMQKMEEAWSAIVHTQGRNPQQQPQKRFYREKFATINAMIRNYDRNQGEYADKVDFIVSMALHQGAGHDNEEPREVDEVEEEEEDNDEEEAEQQDVVRLRDLFND